MLTQEKETQTDTDLLFIQIKSLIMSQPVDAVLDHPDEGFRKVQEAMAYLSCCLVETNEFLKQLSVGNLNAVVPGRHNFLAGSLKELHSGLRHLTWQANQVANGDYKQKVSFLGEFSDSFNAMIWQLEERENELTAQAAELSQSMELMVSIMDKVKEWVIAVDQETGEMIYINRSAKENYYDAEQNTFRCQSHCGGPCKLMGKLAQIRQNQSAEKHIHFSCPSCDRILSVEFNRIRWGAQRACVYFVEDVTSEIGEREELQSLAFQDALTGLYNRRYCMSKLSELIDTRQLFSVCVIDLNRLKFVNDTYGHLVGDEYITCISETMLHIVADEKSTVCRVGGDEFILLLPEYDQAQALALLARLADAVSAIAETKDFPMAISYGVVDVLPQTAIALERILQEADTRMYQMKEQTYRAEDGSC